MVETPKVYTVAEAAEVLRCSPDCVRGHIAAGDLQARPIGQGKRRRRWIITDAALQAFMMPAAQPKPTRRKVRPAAIPTTKFLR